MPPEKLTLIPLPAPLEPLQRQVQAWAVGYPMVHRVFLFGSTLRLKPDASDVDLAVELPKWIEPPAVLRFLLDHQTKWSGELTAITGRPVDLQFYHRICPNVCRYLQEDGCAILWERP
jgi:predicted nucleotidyltransferase